MTVSSDGWGRYIARLSAVNRKASQLMQGWMDANPGAGSGELIRAAYDVSGRYGEAAASLACEMYDSLAEAQGAAAPPAEPAPTATFQETAKAVMGAVKNGRSTVPATVGRLTKQAGADTMLKNARRDGAEWAWVPRGDTCAFCITLASRGWQKASKKALNGGHAEHIHANCDCEYAVRFDGKSSVEGYDPEKYLKMYREAEGSSAQEKINSMRQAQYAANKDEINARKREKYAESKERMAKKSGWDLILAAIPIQHTEAEVKEILAYAEEKGCLIVNAKAFDGDIGMLRDQIDAIEEIREEFDLPRNTPMKVHFQDMAAGDLAKTGINGDVIHFNHKVLRDRSLTNAYLNEDMALSSIDAKGIAYHEMGHVISRYKGEKGLETAKKAYYNLFGVNPDDEMIEEYLGTAISEYSITDSALSRKRSLKEIIPEILAKDKTNPTSYTNEFCRLLREA